MDKFESPSKPAESQITLESKHKNLSANPLTATEIKQEATKLENFAKSFIQGNERAKNFQSWNQELLDLAQHDRQSVHDVFRQMEADSKAQYSVDRNFPTIWATHVGNDEQINVANSPEYAGLDSDKYRDMSGIIDQHWVFSGGASKNYRDDFQILTNLEVKEYQPTGSEKGK